MLSDFCQRIFGCSPEIATAIAARATDRSYLARAPILHQGDEPLETFLLVIGRAHALLFGAEGQMVLIREYEPGDIFGAVAELRAPPADADIVAAEPTRLAAFLAIDFLAVIEAYSCVGLMVSRMLMRQLRATTSKMAARAILTAQGRVYAELLRMAALGDGRTIQPAPVLAALAVRVHTTRETASRTVAGLERRGIVRRDSDGLTILAPRRLEELVA